MQEFLSVIVPVYNTELYLKSCIESIQSQEYQNLEIILVDDGSTDESGKICDSFAEMDDRVKVYHIPNSGPAAARNLGIHKATGQYIGFVDSDDTIEPQMYRVMMNAAFETNADMVICNFYTVNRDGTKNAVYIENCSGTFYGNKLVRENFLVNIIVVQL